MLIGTDASNINSGGGLTHLLELLKSFDDLVNDDVHIYIWIDRSVSNEIGSYGWLTKFPLGKSNSNILFRFFWQLFFLPLKLKSLGCEILFVPGSIFLGCFHPNIVMSQNMLPFEWLELRRYGFTITLFRLILLRILQTLTFKKADGVIFLSHFARTKIQKITGTLSGAIKLIPHGVCNRFISVPKKQLPINAYSLDRPYKIIYVSIVDVYKHQWNVVEAVGSLRLKTGWPLSLSLVGPHAPQGKLKLDNAIKKWDPQCIWITLDDDVPHKQVHEKYFEADLGLFASSCENLPIILLELMASGLPIGCSNRGPMPEILRDYGVYFNPEYSQDIAMALELLISNTSLREDLSKKSFEESLNYTWSGCAKDTYNFLSSMIHSNYK